MILYIVFFGLLSISASTLEAAAAPRWCAQGIMAFRKCQQIRKQTDNKIRCVMGLGEKDCFEKIAQGLADMSTFDGGSIFYAGKKYGLKVVMSEKLRNLAATGTRYFSVAVVKASSKLTYDKLKGAKSCHTGVQRSAGWIIPVGTLLENGMMKCIKGNQYASAAEFFSASCASGANSLEYNPKQYGVKKLCALCIGQGAYHCAASRREPYNGYLGAFRCMKDGVGDVAFIKQSIVTSLSDEEQAKYKLLCPDNTVKAPKDFASCNLAGAPAHAVLTRADATEEEIAEYQSLLEAADKLFGKKSTGKVKIFDNQIFSRWAIGLDKLPIERRAYNQYLDLGYIAAITQLDKCGED